MRAGTVARANGCTGMAISIGTAGWSIPRQDAGRFGAGGSALARYATRFGVVEINSSFHRPHRPSTWARWADAVPDNFRFAVKLPRTITHDARLAECDALLAEFLAQAAHLGPKLAVLLVQLPPKLAFDPDLARRFFSHAACISAAQLVCEPRHPSWFGSDAEDLLAELGVSRVAADPAPVESGQRPGGSPALRYWRLHGSPQVYRSAYGPERLAPYGDALRAEAEAGREAWCIFDNTASSAATGDALWLAERLWL